MGSSQDRIKRTTTSAVAGFYRLGIRAPRQHQGKVLGLRSPLRRREGTARHPSGPPSTRFFLRSYQSIQYLGVASGRVYGLALDLTLEKAQAQQVPRKQARITLRRASLS